MLGAPSLRAVVGTWGAPPDAAAWLALGLGIALGLLAARPRGRVWLERVVFEAPLRRFLWATCGLAALGSLGYVAYYLRGGPRIVDATTYWLEARALAGGQFTFAAGFPSAATRGRFLLYEEADGALGGLFPPGYPALLSLGMRLGAPMVVGPLTAAALIAATRALGVRAARELAGERPDAAFAERVGRLAALFSLVSATLRYHTADTMSHGATALYVACGLLALLEWRRAARPALAACVGLALGALIATRPVSAIPLALVALAVIAAPRPRAAPPRRLGRLVAFGLLALGALPGLVLLAAWQRALTGHLTASPQLMYYARSDGPAGCFRYGFGAGIGCLYEHGDFVRHNLAHGYGALAALGTTARRLKMHLADAANLELAFPLLLLPLVTQRSAATRLLGAMLGLQVLAYAPFYFDGNYPGGGARFFADVLPLEHTLLALALAGRAHAHARADVLQRDARPWLALGAALVGFAVHTSFDHRALAAREGGVPYFEPDVLTRADVRAGLVFVDTDHGFALGHTPGADPARAPLVLRWRGDDHDWLAFTSRGRPPTWRYRLDAGVAHLDPWAPPPPSGPLRFEAEADWPPLAQNGGYAFPTWMSGTASGDRVLTLTPTPATGAAWVALALPCPSPGTYGLVPRVFAPAGAAGRVRVGAVEWSFVGASRLIELAQKPVTCSGPEGGPPRETRLLLETNSGTVSLDRVLMFPPGSTPRAGAPARDDAPAGQGRKRALDGD